MVLVTLREAAEKLPELFESALNGETVVIVGDDQRQVTLTAKEGETPKRTFDSAKGLFTMSEDFDDPLPDLEEFFS
jgi:antitoxin (DNA-binding transcriptional repressor) of toxin-antitoxin stability system